jgi:predicted enzyme related to lactoylglutathione lyase
VISYVLVEDLEATAAEIEANGGKVLQPREEAPGQGFYLTFAAPGGETMVAWENAGA